MQAYFYAEDEPIPLQRQAGQGQTTHPIPDNFAYIVLVESTHHTEETPFCFCDPDCPCHDDQEAIQTVSRWIQEGWFDDSPGSNRIYFRPDALRGGRDAKPMGGECTPTKTQKKKSSPSSLSNTPFDNRRE